MKLSIIDLSVVPANGNRHQAIKNTLETAQEAEKSGFTRIWLAEHHGTGALAGRVPEVMIPYVAANTHKIKVGTGSILLNHYSPYKVAEVFGSLEDIFPGRIDMGIGRATTGPVIDIALQRNRSFRQMTDDSDEQLTELVNWMNDRFDGQHPFSKIKVANNGSLPDFWVLGSSPWSASAAAGLGLRYSFAGFINPDQSFSITQKYIRDFMPSHLASGVKKPELILSLSVYCAPTEEEANRLSAPAQLMMKRLLSGDIQRFMEEEETAVNLLGGLMPAERLKDPRIPPRILAGTPDQLYEELSAIGDTFQTDEIMIQCITPNHIGRLQSHKLLADRFGL